MQVTNTATPRQFDELTGVRAIAAWMVYFHHFNPSVDLTGELGLAIIQEFHIGVTLFFTLSGFLIYYSYHEQVEISRAFLFNYIRNRVARIYPLYFFVVGLSAVVFWITQAFPVKQIIQDFFLQITFIRGFADSLKFIGVGQGWTLTVEETFYLLFPFMLLIIRKRGFLFTLIAVYLTGFFLLWVGSTYVCQNFFSPWGFMAFYTFFGRAFEFFAGMWLASRFKAYLEKNPERLKNNFPLKTTIGVGGFMFSLLLLSQYRSLREVTFIASLAGTISLNDLIFIAFLFINNFLLPIFICFLFIGLLTENSPVRNFLKTPGMVLFGKTSYAFYLVHTGVIQQFVSRHFTTNLFAIFIIINLICVALYFGIEEPARQLIRKLKIGKPENKEPDSSVETGKPKPAPPPAWRFVKISLAGSFVVIITAIFLVIPLINTIMRFFPNSTLAYTVISTTRTASCTLCDCCVVTHPLSKTLHASAVVGDTASLTFEGEQITLVFTKATSRGIMGVQIDDQAMIEISQTTGGDILWQSQWTSDKLPIGQHNITLYHLEGTFTDVDGAIILNGSDTYTIDDNNPAWRFNGEWTYFDPENFPYDY